MRSDLAASSLLLMVAPAVAEETPLAAFTAPLTGREVFLAAVIGAMMACGLASFFLAGRVSDRTQIALAMFVVLIGAFGLLVLFGGFIYGSTIGAVAIVLLLIGLFKLMNQFEGMRKKPPATKSQDRA